MLLSLKQPNKRGWIKTGKRILVKDSRNTMTTYRLLCPSDRSSLLLPSVIKVSFLSPYTTYHVQLVGKTMNKLKKSSRIREKSWCPNNVKQDFGKTGKEMLRKSGENFLHLGFPSQTSTEAPRRVERRERGRYCSYADVVRIL